MKLITLNLSEIFARSLKIGADDRIWTGDVRISDNTPQTINFVTSVRRLPGLGHVGTKDRVIVGEQIFHLIKNFV